MHSSVAAAATDLRPSKIIHQPFRIDAVTVQSDASLSDDVRVNVYVENNDATVGSADDRGRIGPWETQSEGLTGNEIEPAKFDTVLPVGKIYRNIPARIIAVSSNGAGATRTVTVFVSVTYLAELDLADDHAEAY